MKLEKPGHYQKKEKRSGLFFFFFKEPSTANIKYIKKNFF